jgi:Poxvirus D5 protein-like
MPLQLDHLLKPFLIRCQSCQTLMFMSGTLSLPPLFDFGKLLRVDGATPADQRQANVRFEKVMAYLQGEKDRYAAVAPRTLHRWVARFREEEETLGCGYVGLLSRKAAQGNYAPKAPSVPRELMDTFITELFETPRRTPAASVYRAYEQECRKRSLQALSSRAFYQRIKQRWGLGKPNCGKEPVLRILSNPGSGN